MLRRLHIRNFAIIDQLEIEFDRGLSILSGETGAGKSILIDALGLVLGDRADKAFVSESAKQAEITAEFEAVDRRAVTAWLDDQAIEAGDEIIVRRVIGRDGRSRALVNGVSVAIQNLRALGEALIEIHGQHAHQLLTRPTTQREIVDRFGVANKSLQKVSDCFATWQVAEKTYTDLKTAAADRDNRLEYLRFQLDEFERHAESLTDFQALQSERDRLRHADRLQAAADAAAAAVYDDETANAQSLVASATSALAGLSEYADEVADIEQLLSEAEASLQEAGFSLQRFAEGLSSDPTRQLKLDDTLAAITELARKHRCEVPELSGLAEKFSEEANQLDALDVELEALAETRNKALKSYQKAARALSRERQAAAAQLEPEVTAAMQELGMVGGRLAIEIKSDEQHFAANGMDSILFLVSANAGREPQPLGKVASGGELSRISLAVQVITADVTSTPTMVFDEVDAGIGGGVAEIVGARLREIGTDRQVLCVTHLPQVASQGHQHFQISKISDGKSTHTQIRELSMKARIDEIARMLGGVDITAKSRAHAKEMLDGASRLSRSA